MRRRTSAPPVFALLSAILSVGCLSPKPLTERPSPQAYVLPEVPLERWGDNTCGAGALSAVMRHHGHSVTEEDLIPLLPTGRNGGVVSVDLLIAAKRYGFDASLVRGSEEDLQQSLTAGEPVIIMVRVADFPGESRDLFHYLVVDGYDPGKGLYRTQFGDATARWLPIAKLDDQWAATDYATLTLAPGEPGGEESDRRPAMKRAVLLEEEGRDLEAARLYRAIIGHEPENALAWLNLGNVQMRLGASEQAEASYRQALDLSPGDRDVMNNLAWLLVTERRSLEEAELLARRASLEPGPDAFLYLDTLGEVLRARGNCDDAIEQFQTALFSVPGSHDSHRLAILLNLGRAQIDCGQDEQARQTLERALAAGASEEQQAEIRSLLEPTR